MMLLWPCGGGINLDSSGTESKDILTDGSDAFCGDKVESLVELFGLENMVL